MRSITLYTGSGKTFSPVREEGMVESSYVRLIADAGMGITDGVMIATVIDTNDPERWTDSDAPVDPDPQEDATSTDYETALSELGVNV